MLVQREIIKVIAPYFLGGEARPRDVVSRYFRRSFRQESPLNLPGQSNLLLYLNKGFFFFQETSVLENLRRLAGDDARTGRTPGAVPPDRAADVSTRQRVNRRRAGGIRVGGGNGSGLHHPRSLGDHQAARRGRGGRTPVARRTP